MNEFWYKNKKIETYPISSSLRLSNKKTRNLELKVKNTIEHKNMYKT